jgi:hypothetical protein
VPSDIQRLAQAIENLADQQKNDAQHIDRNLDRIIDQLHDQEIRLERIETRFRRQEEERAFAGEPTARMRSPSGAYPITGEHPLVPIGGPATTPIPFDNEPSAITADQHKITLRWDFLLQIWKGLRWVLLFGGGALAAWLKGYVDKP